MKFKKTASVLLAAAVLASFTASGCGSSINADAVAATLDGRDISLGTANFIAQVQAVQMDSYLLSYYGEDMWNKDSGDEDGTTMTESVKKSVMERLEEYYLMDAHAADYNVELTDEEKTAITEAAAKFLSDNTSEALSVMSATQETVEEMLRLYKVQSKMHDAIIEDIDTNVTDEECAQKTFSYVRFNKSEEPASTADDTDADADTSDDMDTSADDADQKAEAEEFLAAAADDMEAAAESKEYTVQTCSYGSGDLKEDENTTSMDVSVLKAADKLKKGKLADSLIETDSAYYVIRMDSTDDKAAAETKKESILSKRRDDKYDEVLQGYKDACEWKINESEWKKVNFDELYTLKQEETTTDDTSGTDDSGTGTAADDASGTDDSGTGTTADDGSETAADDGTGSGGSETAADDASGDGEAE